MTEKLKAFQKRYESLNLAVRASLWVMICSVIQKGISVITMPIFTRIMSISEFGRYSIFLSWYNILIIFVTLHIHEEIFNKGMIEHCEDRDEYQASQMGLLMVLAGGMIALNSIFHGAIGRVMHLPAFLFCVVVLDILGNALMGLWYARQRFEFKYQKMVAVTLGNSVVTPLLGICMVSITDQQAEAKILSNAFFPVLASSILIVMFVNKGRFFSHMRWWKIAIAAAIPLVPHYLSQVLLNQSDKLMIDYFVNSEATAIYSIAHTAGLLLIILNNSINASFVPWSYERLKKGQTEGMHKVVNILLVLVMAINLMFIWLAPEAVGLLAAAQYADAVYCLAPIACSVYFCFVYMLFVDMEIYYGANQYVAAASIFAAIVNIILNLIFIPAYGYIAAGYTTLASYFMTTVMHYLFLKHTIKSHPEVKFQDVFQLKVIMAVGFAMLCMMGLAVLLYHRTVIRILICLGMLIAALINKNKILQAVKMLKK